MSQFRLLLSPRLWPLTLAQSCGAMNDNLVKNAMLVLALFKLGASGASGTGLSALAGALFIAPYIVLSATAGTLADRFAKPRLIVAYKIVEVALMAAASVAFLFASVPGLLAVLAGLGVQASLFGPVKYGVLPEYLTEGELLAGNGIIEATTFVFIVCGTVAGGGLMLLDDGAAVVSATGVAIAVLGLFGALRMPARPPADPGLKLSFNLVAETAAVIRASRGNRLVWWSLMGLSWFWTIGATLLTEFPVAVHDTMQAEGTVLTLLLTVFAIGVGAGSMATAAVLKNRISARFTPYAALGISVFCWDFAYAVSAADGLTTVSAVLSALAGWRMMADLFVLAACGGLLSVPLYAIMQDAAAGAERSRMIAANNIVNAVFILGGSAAAAGLAAMGLDAPAVLRVAAAVNLLVAAGIAVGLARKPLATQRQ